MQNYENYKKYLESVSIYNSKAEKDTSILLLEEGKYSPLEIAKSLNISPEPSNNLEAIAMIFMSRKKSIGEGIETTIKCPYCNHKDFYFFNIDNLFFKDSDTISEEVPVKLINDIEDIDDEFINNISLEELSYYEDIIISNNKKIFDNNIEVTCNNCKEKFKTSINYEKIISKFSIKNIYEQYLDLSTLGNMSKRDIDEMPPYEREIFLGIIQERENKQN